MLACADCDDEEPRNGLGWPEVCNDGVDKDCDQEIDESCITQEDLDAAIAAAIAEYDDQAGCNSAGTRSSQRAGIASLLFLLVFGGTRRRR